VPARLAIRARGTKAASRFPTGTRANKRVKLIELEEKQPLPACEGISGARRTIFRLSCGANGVQQIASEHPPSVSEGFPSANTLLAAFHGLPHRSSGISSVVKRSQIGER
jgi:hypothetical protein